MRCNYLESILLTIIQKLLKNEKFFSFIKKLLFSNYYRHLFYLLVGLFFSKKINSYKIEPLIMNKNSLDNENKIF